MTKFETAYYITNRIEGGYANDPDDKGGETYRGIARNFHPDWNGWATVDDAKKKISNIKSINNLLDNDSTLQKWVMAFYCVEFWDKINGDLIPDQLIANEVYDNAVNMGINSSGEYLQRTINILNRNQNAYADIEVDGNLGPKTIEALKVCIKKNGAKRVLNVINGFQIKHYLELMEKNPTNEKYIGWFDRVDIVWN